ncbi:MAG: phospho-N-acetylmuramoyl-pentapeptide-transferase, partial [Candidatus Methylopumilus sp.]
MLLELFKLLAKEIHGFNVFNYITLRAVMSTITSLVISFAFGPWLIKKLNQYNIGQAVRSDGPKDHLIKTGT